VSAIPLLQLLLCCLARQAFVHHRAAMGVDAQQPFALCCDRGHDLCHCVPSKLVSLQHCHLVETASGDDTFRQPLTQSNKGYAKLLAKRLSTNDPSAEAAIRISKCKLFASERT